MLQNIDEKCLLETFSLFGCASVEGNVEMLGAL
jgi:hypothetical protein